MCQMGIFCFLAEAVMDAVKVTVKKSTITNSIFNHRSRRIFPWLFTVPTGIREISKKPICTYK